MLERGDVDAVRRTFVVPGKRPSSAVPSVATPAGIADAPGACERMSSTVEARVT